ncbi:MAG TPA: DUF2380 domain-containing protein [Bradyrhizobium sp.]|nr:DUF2380 domain-containing protein [Bradyrhizobium sp.]
MRNALLSRRLSFTVAAIFLLGSLGSTAALSDASAKPAKSVAIDDFGYLDTSNEPTDQAAAHQRRLQDFMAALRGDVGADQRFQLVASSCAPACADDGPALAERLRAAAKDGATILIIGNIHKMSTLVQWARLAAIDTASGRVVLEKLFTFRGDNDEAWQRAASFVSEELRAGLAGGPAPASPVALAPIRLAVFPFELDDTSAAAESTGETTSDATGLADTTDAIRQLLAQSGRYRLVDVATSGAAAKTPTLHDCSGCDAPIALGLGADQSLVGVIRRISRTEYIVGIQLRDAHGGNVIATADSGLRMGANYSWSRGATRLVRDHLLEGGQQ